MNDIERNIAILDKAIELIEESKRPSSDHWYLCHAIDGAAGILSGQSPNGFMGSRVDRMDAEWRRSVEDLHVQIESMLDGIYTLEGWIACTVGTSPSKLDSERVKATRLAWARWIKDQQ